MPTRKFDGWCMAMAALSTAWCVWAGWQLGATYDEPFYITQGLNAWRTGTRHELYRVGAMPLPVDAATLPLYLWERARQTTIDPTADLWSILPWARLPTLLFWWLALYYGWRLAHDLAGRAAARLAVALLAFEPNLLAHASLATTDMALLACLLAFACHYRSGRATSPLSPLPAGERGEEEAGWRRRVGWPAFWLAAAVLAKASGLVYGVLLLWIIEAERLLRGRQLSPVSFRRFLSDGIAIGALGLAGAFVYCGSDWQGHPSLVKWANSLPESSIREYVVWLTENLRIFSNAGVALLRQVKHNIQGHGVFIAGVAHPRALWYYFPLLLLIKLPLSLLLAPVVLACRRPRLLCNWAIITAAVLLAFSVTFRVQIGIRLVLPVVAFGIIGTSAAMANIVTSRSTFAALATALVLWTALATLRVGPHALCYTNEFWGGPRDGYLYVSDANYDWGQGLKELDAWRRRCPQRPLAISYFGADPQLQRLPIKQIRLHLVKDEKDFLQQVQGHWLAISTTHMYGAYLPPGNAAIAHLLRLRPVARTQTFLLFDFSRSGDLAGILP